MTPQRMVILDHLKSVKTHPNAEAVYAVVQKKMPAITLATVYRNLNMLAKQDLILKLEINNEFHFDGDTCAHQHCICKHCGKIIDVFHKNISDYALKNIHTKDFRPERVSVLYHGVCKGCN